ncbi:MAG: hypothetical protein IT453_13880 [Planctomycetes bacterium]|nr:hypothetical protein [Planctomycetota bacterium]
MFPAALLLALASLATVPAPSAANARTPDVAQSLAALAAPRAGEREEAERWLALHLSSSDFAAVAEFLPRAEFEARARLAQALGADARHFDLARRLALSSDVAVRTCGVRATRTLVERWLGAPDGPPTADLGGERLTRDAALTFRLRLDGRSLEELVDLVARRAGRAGGVLEGGEPVPVWIDLGLAADAERPFEGSAALLGPWDELLTSLASAFDARVTLYGSADGRAFAMLSRRASGAVPGSVTEWLLVRSRVALEAPDAGERERAARALAVADFPPALALLAERWREQADPAMLSGLALAAARGRVASELVSQDAARALVRRAETALAAGGSRARFLAAECARALANVRDALDGSRPLDVLGEGLDGASLAARTWRLRAARLAGANVPALDALARELVLADPPVGARAPDVERALAAAAAFEYLAARGLAAGLAFAEPAAWLAAESARGRGPTFVAAWARAGLALPDAWRRPELGPELAFAVFAAGWDGASAEPATVARFRAALRTDALSLATADAWLEEWRQSGRRDGVAALVDAALASAVDASERDALERLEARLGRVQGARAKELGERWLAASEPDWVALGSLAASPVGVQVRQRLTAALAALGEPANAAAAGPAGPAGPLGRGIERAFAVLYAAGNELGASDFERRLAAVLPKGVPGPLERFAEARAAGAWPVSPSRRPIDLAAKDLQDGF